MDSNFYEILEAGKDASTRDITQQYRNWIERLDPDKIVAKEGAFDALSPLECKYQAREYHPNRKSLHWKLLKLLVLCISILFLFFLLVVKFARRTLFTLKNVIHFKPKRQMRWCDSCGEYHVISNEEGEVWEENGRYYYRKQGTAYDVTTLVQTELGNQSNAVLVKEEDANKDQHANGIQNGDHSGKNVAINNKNTSKKGKASKSKGKRR
jgi:hypothetical protein